MKKKKNETSILKEIEGWKREEKRGGSKLFVGGNQKSFCKLHQWFEFNLTKHMHDAIFINSSNQFQRKILSSFIARISNACTQFFFSPHLGISRPPREAISVKNRIFLPKHSAWCLAHIWATGASLLICLFLSIRMFRDIKLPIGAESGNSKWNIVFYVQNCSAI